MEIDFSDYLSETERKQIIADVFREQCSEKFRQDEERIFTNAAYRIVTEECDKLYGDGKWAGRIATHVHRVIATMSSYTVFAKANAWERKNSKGYDLLEEAVANAKPLIEERVASLIGGFSQEDLRSLISDAIYNICDENLFKRKDTNQ